MRNCYHCSLQHLIIHITCFSAVCTLFVSLSVYYTFPLPMQHHCTNHTTSAATNICQQRQQCYCSQESYPIFRLVISKLLDDVYILLCLLAQQCLPCYRHAVSLHCLPCYHNAMLLQCRVTTMPCHYNAVLLHCQVTTMPSYCNAMLLQCQVTTILS